MSLEGEEFPTEERNYSFSPSNKYSAGRWTEEEHNRFLEALDKFGKDWKKVQEYIETRNSSQIRSHAQKYFNKLLKGSEPKKSHILSNKNLLFQIPNHSNHALECSVQNRELETFSSQNSQIGFLKKENFALSRDESDPSKDSSQEFPNFLINNETHNLMMDKDFNNEEEYSEGNFLNFKMPLLNYDFERIFN